MTNYEACVASPYGAATTPVGEDLAVYYAVRDTYWRASQVQGTWVVEQTDPVDSANWTPLDRTADPDLLQLLVGTRPVPEGD